MSKRDMQEQLMAKYAKSWLI